ncbi:MAG TPA: SurA N-terminal domain-containing protein, partial [Candidatus Polarisedimenticolia bacterium]|nr:SurA N-terminal domain-containing protein [Candidatus Polarisedimenticolia bacterium]
MISGRLIRPLLALALLTAALGTVPKARAEILEEIVAKVNNEIITLTEFEARLELFRQQISRKYSGDDLDAKMEESRDLLLHNMIIESLLVQRGDVILDMEKVRKNLLDDFKKQQKIEND